MNEKSQIRSAGILFFAFLFLAMSVLAMGEASEFKEVFYVEKNASLEISFPEDFISADKYSLSVIGTCKSDLFDEVIHLKEIQSNLSVSFDAYFKEENKSLNFSVFLIEKNIVEYLNESFNIENETIINEENESEENSNEIENVTNDLNDLIDKTKTLDEELVVDSEVIQSNAEVGKPVEWTHKIKVQNNYSVNKEIVINSSIPVEADKTLVFDNESKKIKIKDSVKNTNKIKNYLNLEKETDKIKEVSFKENLKSGESKEYEIKYETPAPEKIESSIVNESGKLSKNITVKSESSVHYKNVLSWSNIPESKREQVRLYWLVEGVKTNVVSDKRFNVTLYDSDNNGLIDRVSWIVPHLSEQHFIIEIIEITSAFHLDSEKNFISDISEELFERDDIWSEGVDDGEYVRVVFEENLTDEKDITIFARIVSGLPSIEVYEKDGSEVLAVFDGLWVGKYKKIYLTNLIGEQDSFDLKVVGGSLEFDHIIDPNAVYDGTQGAPFCSGASPCVANSTMLECSNSQTGGPEQNQPNTIDACADSTTSGTCHDDESVENITITDLNNSEFEAGDTIQVNYTIWCWDGTSDRYALYYTNSTSSVNWRRITSGNPICPARGYYFISEEIVLDDVVGNHSIRAINKYSSDIATACDGASYTDSDDVAFYVASANSAPSTPTNISCDRGSCNATFVNDIELNCSGPVDTDGDVVTYVIEAALENTTTISNSTDFSFSLGSGIVDWDFIGSDNAAISTVTTQSIDFSETLQQGDLVVIGGAIDYNADDFVINTAGYSEIFNSGDANPFSILAYKVMGATPDSSVSVSTLDAGTNDREAAVVLQFWRGVNSTTPLDTASRTTAAGGSGMPNSPSYTPGFNNALIYSVGFLDDDSVASSVTVPSGFSNLLAEDAGTSGSQGVTTMMTSLVQTTASAVNPATFGGSGSDDWDAITFAFNKQSDRGALSEQNSSWVTYSNLNGDYYSLSNISVIVEVDSYNPSASAEQSTDYPDLQLEIYNSTDWIEVGNFSLNESYVGDNLQTTNYNFTLSTTESSVLSAWENSTHQDIRIRGVKIDAYNQTYVDEINYTDIWVTIDGDAKKWSVVGNHTGGSSYLWNVSNYAGQTGIDLRCRGIDEDGSGEYSDYFTKGSNVTIFEDTILPVIELNAPADSSAIANSTINFNFTVTDDYASNLDCSLYINGSLNQTNSSTLNNSLTNFEVIGLAHGLYEWNISCDDSTNVNWSETRDLFVNMTPYLDSVTPIPDPIAGGNTIAISPENYYDPSNDNLYYYCVNDSSLEITLANTVCSQGNTQFAYPYATMNCTYEVPATTHTQDVYCRLYDGIYYSDNVTASFDSDASVPATSVNSVAGDSSAPYYDTTNDGQTNITVDGESGMNCRWYTSDQEYNAGTGNPCTTTGTQAICVTTPSEGLPDYYVACADSLGNGQNSTQNLDVTSITVDWTSPTTSDDSSGSIQVPDYSVTISEADNVDSDPETYYCVDTTGICDPLTLIDDGGQVTFTSSNRGQNYLRYNSSDYVGNSQSVQNISIRINQLPLFGEANANESGVIKGGNAIRINTWSNDSDSGQNLVLYVCDSNDVDSIGCNDGTYCTNTTSQDNVSCVFASETDSSGHNWYAFIYDGLGEVAVNNYSGSYTTDSEKPFITISSPENITYNESTISASVSLSESGSWVVYSLDGGSNVSLSNITSQVWTGILSSLSDVQHNITFWANDSYGNMNNSEYVYFYINSTPADMVSPIITLYTPTNGTYYSNLEDFLINLTSDEDLRWAGYNYNGTLYDLDNDSLRNWYIELNDFSGEDYYNLTVYANDTSNNQNSKSVQFYTDELAPRYENTQANPSPTNVSVAVNCSVYWNDTYRLTNVKISENSSGTHENHTIDLSSTGWANYTIVGSKLTNIGTYECIFYASDDAGNSNSTSATFDVNDVTKPEITILVPSNSTYNQEFINSSIIISENSSSAWFSLNSTENITMSNLSKTAWKYNISGLNDGGYNITFYSNDTSGNLGVSDTIYFTIDTGGADTVPPVLTIDYPVNGTYYQSTELFLNVTSNENLDSAWYSLNGSANVTMDNSSTINWNGTLSGLGTENSNNVSVYANDTSGNNGTRIVIFYTDTLAPRMNDVQANPSPANETQTVNCSVYVTDAFDLSSVKVAENSTGSFVNHTLDLSSTGWANYSIIDLDKGGYQCIFYATDSAGNSNSTSVTFDVNDVTKPDITINSPLNQTYSSSSILLSVTLSENVTGDVNYSLDGAANTSLRASGLSWSKTISVLDGGHNVTFYAEDTSNNLNSIQIFFTVDTSVNDITPPSIVIWSPANEVYYNSPSTLLNMTTTENASWAGYTNNSGSLQDLGNTSLINWNATIEFSEGQHNITFYANDTSSNKNQGNSSVTIYVDLNNPSVETFVCDTSINDSDDVTCNLTLSDAVGLDYGIISYNATGIWVNSSNISLSGTSDTIDYIILSGNTTPNDFQVKTYVFDSAGRMNGTEFYDIAVLDNVYPNITNITYAPSSADDLDSGVVVNVTATIGEDYNISKVYLMYMNDSVSEWTFEQMTNNSVLVVGSASSIVYNASFTATQNDTWYFKINATDYEGNENVSLNYSLDVQDDTSQNVSTTIPSVKSVTYAQRSSNNSMGILNLSNIGDTDLSFNVSLYSSSIQSRLSLNYTGNSSETYSIFSGNFENFIIDINTTSLTSGLYTYTINVTSAAGTEGYTRQLNVQTADGPYLDVEIDIYSASVLQSQSDVDYRAIITNLGTADATGVFLNWTLPAGFSLATGSLNRDLGNVPVSSSGTNTITVDVSSSAGTPLTILANGTSTNADSVSDSKEIIVVPITTTPVIPSSSSSSSGGGGSGGSAYVSGTKAFYDKVVDVVRGEEDYFEIIIDNKYASPLQDLTLRLEGFPSKYISITPSTIGYIAPGEKDSFRVYLTAPIYEEFNAYELKAYISGYLVNTSRRTYSEIQNIQLFIQEVSLNDTNYSLSEAENAIQKMKNYNFNSEYLNLRYEEAIKYLEQHQYREAYDIANEIVLIKEKAFYIADLIIRIEAALEDPRKTSDLLTQAILDFEATTGDKVSFSNIITGNVIFEDKDVKGLLELAIIAFERGDYDLAKERAENARVLLLLEIKGNFGLFLYLYWHLILVSFILISFVGIVAFKKYQKVSIVSGIVDLNKEELNIAKLFKKDQKSYFSGNISSTEYDRKKKHNQKRLAEIKRERIVLRNKRIKMFKPQKVKVILKRELTQVENDIKKLQNKFYNDRKISPNDYQMQFKILNERLAEIEKEKIFMQTKGNKKNEK